MSATEAVRELVAERTQVADGVVALVLRDPSGTELPAWAPARTSTWS